MAEGGSQLGGVKAVGLLVVRVVVAGVVVGIPKGWRQLGVVEVGVGMVGVGVGLEAGCVAKGCRD